MAETQIIDRFDKPHENGSSAEPKLSAYTPRGTKTQSGASRSSRPAHSSVATSSPMAPAKSSPAARTGGARSQTLLINSKIRHIKKKDGEPLWRKDIQYDFLREIFYDDTRVFTNSYDGTPNHSYSEIYVDAMARSSKSSKVLREKLLGDSQAALNIAMVCLLVNIGRMNTTLNCRLRLYSFYRNNTKFDVSYSFPGDARSATDVSSNSFATILLGPYCL